MKKLILGMLISVMLVMSVSVVMALPNIDGIISSGEWDTYYLGTSVTGWCGGMEVDVYGFADATDMYAAYVVDIANSPGYTACGWTCVSANFYTSSPTNGWPSPGYSILGFGGDGYGNTDGSWGWQWPYGWGNPSGQAAWNAIGVYYYVGDQCYNTVPSPNVAEIKAPLSLIKYADLGGSEPIMLTGQYWQYDWATPFYVTLPAPTKADVLQGNSVPGKGITNAPGLQKDVPNDKFAKGTENKP